MATPAKIATDYQESFQFLQAKKRRQANQLGLLNNIRRGDEYLGSTLLVTLFDRILSSLYDDKIQVKFLPSQGINQDQINAYNTLAQSDYQEMGKSKLDYDWCWDTLFFGRGYMETLRFDKKQKIMKPHVINPLAMGYDPYNANPQDWRYYWKWITKNKWEIDALIKAGVLKNLKKAEDLPSGIDPFLWQYKITLDQARGAVVPPIEPADHDLFQILEYFGYNDKGKRSVYWTDKNASKVIYEQELDLEDGEDTVGPDGTVVETGSRWPIVMKEAFRQPHSSVPFSVADLLEDKHRAKAVLLNLAYIAAKDQANPVYGYNPDKVRDVSQFLSRKISQHIPMDDETASWPLRKEPAMSPDLVTFIEFLDREAEDPVGAGKPMQPTGSTAVGTATQAALDQQLNDMAQSLQSKVLQFGETEFWAHWFARYAKYGPEIKEKMANIVGVRGIDSKIIDLKHFQSDFPPGIMVYSAKEAEYKNLVKRRDFMQLYPAFQQSMDPDGFRNFNKHVFMPLMVEDPSLIEIMFPKDMDEIKAEAENDLLAKDEYQDASDTDNHTTHIYIHSQLMPKTLAVWFHIAEHQEMLAEQKRQMMMQQQIEQSMGALEGGKPQVGAEKSNPVAQAAPLRTEVKSSNKPVK